MAYPASAVALPAPDVPPAPDLASLPSGGYAELKRRVVRAGLLERQPGYYRRKIVFTVLLPVPSLVLLAITRNPWLQLGNAVYLACVFAQFSFLGHDVGHLQYVRAGRSYTILTLLFGNCLTAISPAWWKLQHDRHHSHPNRMNYDPNYMLPVVAFSSARARTMSRLQRVVIRRQAVLFPIMLMFEAVVIRCSGISYLLAKRTRRWLVELLLIGLHLGIYAAVLIYFLGVVPALGFMVVHQLVYGFYLGMAFAPNHKGMAVFDDGNPPDFLLEQVLASRNVAPGPIVDFLFGNLNLQIEHHLFPAMPRNRLRDAQPLVQAFCREHGIPYCQTGVYQAYRDILGSLHAVGASLSRSGGRELDAGPHTP